eukprot:6477112-Amphidinium_carterae.1
MGCLTQSQHIQQGRCATKYSCHQRNHKNERLNQRNMGLAVAHTCPWFLTARAATNSSACGCGRRW